MSVSKEVTQPAKIQTQPYLLIVIAPKFNPQKMPTLYIPRTGLVSRFSEAESSGILVRFSLAYWKNFKVAPTHAFERCARNACAA
jgi:hypothetical protein